MSVTNSPLPSSSASPGWTSPFPSSPFPVFHCPGPAPQFRLFLAGAVGFFLAIGVSVMIGAWLVRRAEAAREEKEKRWGGGAGGNPASGTSPFRLKKRRHTKKRQIFDSLPPANLSLLTDVYPSQY